MTSVKLLATTHFNTWQLAKAEAARALIEATVNGAAFRDGVLAARFLDTRFERADGTVVDSLSNRQILDMLLAGAEAGSAADQVIGLKVSLYYQRWSSAIGWTDEDGVIHTCANKFFNGAEPNEVAGHWMHEWTHAAGFRHDYRRTSRRSQSVPYVVGELIATLAAPAER